MSGAKDFIDDIVDTVTDVFKGAVDAVTGFVGDVFGFLAKPFGAFDVDIPNFDPQQKAEGVKLTKPGTNQGIPVVYGYRRVGSIPIYAETDGEDNKFLYVVYVVCEGEIEGIRRIIVDGHFIGKQPGNVTYQTNTELSGAGRYTDRLIFQVYNGTDDQPQSSLANQAPNWSSKNRRLPGLAYVVCRFEWKPTKSDEVDGNPYGGGIPQLQFDVLGKKVYDVATHSGGLDLSADYSALTKTYSENPANHLLDYMMNSRYGAGFLKEEINADSFKTAANKYNQTIDYVPDGSESGPVVTNHHVLETATTNIIDNVKQILSGCRSLLPYVQGRYKLKVEDGGNPTDITSSTVSVAFDVTTEHIVGQISLTGEQKRTKYNQVIVNYVDPTLEFTSQQVYFSTAGDVAIDDDENLTGEFTYDMIGNRAIAQDFARMIYDKSRTQRQIKFTATQELYNVEVGDIIRVTDSVLDLDQVTFRVMGMTLNKNFTIGIDAVEHDATIYPHVTTEQRELPPPLFLPDTYYNIVRTKPQEPVDISYNSVQNVETPQVEVTAPRMGKFEGARLSDSAFAVSTEYAFQRVGATLEVADINFNQTELVAPTLGFEFGINPFGTSIITIPGKGNPTEITLRPPFEAGHYIFTIFDRGTKRIKSQNKIKFSRFGRVALPVIRGPGYVDSQDPVRIAFPLNKAYDYSVIFEKTTGWDAGVHTLQTGGFISSFSAMPNVYTFQQNGNQLTREGLEALINYLRDTQNCLDSGAVDLGG